MSALPPEPRPRILIVDDNLAIHEDFRKILGAKAETHARLDSIEAELFGAATAPLERAEFRIDSAHQGQEALARVEQALKEGDPYTMAFVDVRMPPGWDGVETLDRIWQCSPELQAVICTAYSDYSWDDMMRRFGHTDNLLILKKPFETVEVLQLVHALTRKWALARQAKLRLEDMDRMVNERTQQLVAVNENLKHEMEERVCAEESLRVSEERFSTAFQCNPSPMAILSGVDRRFMDANQSFVDLCAYQPDQLVRHSDVELQLWLRKNDVTSDALLPDGRLRNLNCFLRRSDGGIRQIVMAAEPLSLGATPCLLLIVEDITEQVKLGAQLRQAQKMEVIGRLAAGVAHEFNNVLTVIQGNVGLLQIPNAPAIDRRALLDHIMHASRRAAAFTKQLLAFSRKQVLQPRSLNLSAVLKHTQKMLFQLIGERFEIQFHCPDELPSVMADEGSMEQVLINLIINARDAMPEGGLIEITTETVNLDDEAAALTPESRPGQFVCLSVKDHGCGMDTQLLTKIFDPFFTTKEVGKGTGLGLSTIHGIVKQHEGWINVASKVGSGTTFKIYFPVCHSPAQPTVVAGAEKDSVLESGRGETILVVEDEDTVREMACMALQKRGYQVIQAANGPQAIEVWNQCATPVRLLLTDMVMPFGMTGGELAKILVTKNPRLQVIYTSGYNTEFLQRDSLLAQGINFIPKPYDVRTLSKAVRHCLDGGTLPKYETRQPKLELATVV
jgi:two-component system cell cycle sensor histidine kinase/response regulator CckA